MLAASLLHHCNMSGVLDDGIVLYYNLSCYVYMSDRMCISISKETHIFKLFALMYEVVIKRQAFSTGYWFL